MEMRKEGKGEKMEKKGKGKGRYEKKKVKVGDERREEGGWEGRQTGVE